MGYRYKRKSSFGSFNEGDGSDESSRDGESNHAHSINDFIIIDGNTIEEIKRELNRVQGQIISMENDLNRLYRSESQLLNKLEILQGLENINNHTTFTPTLLVDSDYGPRVQDNDPRLTLHMQLMLHQSQGKKSVPLSEVDSDSGSSASGKQSLDSQYSNSEVSDVPSFPFENESMSDHNDYVFVDDDNI